MNGRTPSPALVAAIQHLLRPLVRVLVAEGITYPAFCAMLKHLFVAVAESDLTRAGDSVTTSRLTVMTGVHRKDVKRLRTADADPPALSAMRDVSSRALDQWCRDPNYHDDGGRPRSLARRDGAGNGPSFDDLIEAVSTDVRPRTVLDEWVRQGLVHADDDGRIHLDVARLVPSDGDDELVAFFGYNLHDHLASAASNLLSTRRPFLERAVFYGGLTAASSAELEASAREIGNDALLTLNREALARSQRDKGQPGSSRRMSFGVYFYEDEDVEG
jgi:hypothetical protein